MDRRGLALGQRSLAHHKPPVDAEDSEVGEVITIADGGNPKIAQKRSILFLTARRGY
jgi:hypothetical protein